MPRACARCWSNLASIARALFAVLGATPLTLVLIAPMTAQPSAGHRCGSWPKPTGRTTTARTVDDLERAVSRARDGETILLADGTYALRSMIDFAIPNVTLRSASGDRTKVVLHGAGMTKDHVGVALSISASGITVADLTVRSVGNHAVQVRGERGASRFTLHNARLLDTGEQLLKGSTDVRKQVYADDGVVQCSELSYTTHAPSNYTNGVDILNTRGWTIRDNRFLRIRGPESQGWAAGPAILAWVGAEGTVVERNVVLDSFRGIALGLTSGADTVSRVGTKGHDHIGGVIRDNIVVNVHAWGDEGIEVNAGRDVVVERNTVFVAGASPWSIGVRFPSGTAQVRNNLTNRRIILRNGGTAVIDANVAEAQAEWFTDVAAGDVRLTAAAPASATSAGVPPELAAVAASRP